MTGETYNGEVQQDHCPIRKRRIPLLKLLHGALCHRLMAVAEEGRRMLGSNERLSPSRPPSGSSGIRTIPAIG